MPKPAAALPGLLLAFSTALLAQTSPPSAATQRLLERNRMFEPQVVQVADNVYTAIGYQVSANSMIVGDDGVVIVDPRTAASGRGAGPRRF